MHGGTDWCLEKLGGKKPRKTWRKSQIAMDPATGETIAPDLTTEHVSDEIALPICYPRSTPRLIDFRWTEPMMAQALSTALLANLALISKL